MDELTTLLTIIGFDVVVFLIAFLLIRKKFRSVGFYYRFMCSWNVVIVANVVCALVLVLGKFS